MRDMGNWKDAYEAQMELWKWARSTDGKNQMLNTMDLPKLPERTRPLFSNLVQTEEHKLFGADPIFVAEEFCDLCEHAQHSFKPEPLLVTDFLTPQGFVFYEKPIKVPTNHPSWDEELVGFSWTPLMFHRDDGRRRRHHAGGMSTFAEDAEMYPGGVALTLYAALPEERRVQRYEDGVLFRLPAIAPFHFTPWYFDMTFDGNEVDIDGNETSVEIWWRLCQVTLRLMQQKLAARQPTQVERATRRRGERLGFAPRETVVVRLRRHKSAPTGDERTSGGRTAGSCTAAGSGGATAPATRCAARSGSGTT